MINPTSKKSPVNRTQQSSPTSSNNDTKKGPAPRKSRSRMKSKSPQTPTKDMIPLDVDFQPGNLDGKYITWLPRYSTVCMHGAVGAVYHHLVSDCCHDPSSPYYSNMQSWQVCLQLSWKLLV